MARKNRNTRSDIHKHTNAPGVIEATRSFQDDTFVK